MLAAVLTGVRNMELREVPTPQPSWGEARVKVVACGICQTDYSAYTGRRMNWTPPVVVGHEIAGVIDAVGQAVDDWKEGDKVSILPALYCGRCDNCRLGVPHYCTSGMVIGGDGQPLVRDGGFAEYLSVPTDVLYRKPESVSFESAALTEPLAGSYKGMIEYSNLRLGEDVVIVGVGGMGLLLTQVAAAGGAGNLVAIDLSKTRLDKALELGATHAINVESEDAPGQVYAILPKGPDIVFEAAGTLEAARLSFDLVRRGTRINMFGVIIPGTIPISPGDIHFLETRVDASFSVTPRVMTKAIDLMRKGIVVPDRILTHRFPLNDIQTALDTMESPDRIKIMIMP